MSLGPRAQCTQCTVCAGWFALDTHPSTRMLVPRDASIPFPQHRYSILLKPSARHTPVAPTLKIRIAKAPVQQQAVAASYLPPALGIPNARAHVARLGSLMPRRTWPRLFSLVPSGLLTALPPPVPPVPQNPVVPTPVLRPAQPVMDAFSRLPAISAPNVGTRRAESMIHSLSGGPFAPLRPHSGSRRGYPAITTDPLVEIDVVLWPQNVDRDFDLPGYPTDSIRIKNTDLQLYALSLNDNNLALRIEVPGQGLTSPAEFSRQLLVHLAAHNLSMPPFPSDYNSRGTAGLDGQLWVLLESHRRNDVHILRAHSTINDLSFGYKTFQKFTSKLTNVLPAPTPAANATVTTPRNPPPWIFIGMSPRFGNLSGPVDSFAKPSMRLAGVHPCFGMRVIHNASRQSSEDPPDCYDDHCPASASITTVLSRLPAPTVGYQHFQPMTDPAWPVPAAPTVERQQTPPPQPYLVRHRSPGETPMISSQNTLLSGRRVDAMQCVPNAAPMPPSGDEPRNSPSPPPSPPLRPPVPALEAGTDFLEPETISEWRTSLAGEMVPHPSGIPMFSIHTKTVSAAAHCLIDLLIHHENCKLNPDSSFVMEDRRIQENDVVYCPTTIQHESFFREIRMWSIGIRGTLTGDPDTTRTVTQGPGPERAALREGCAILTARFRYWQQATGSDMFRPIFTAMDTPIQERIHTFRAHGTFLALHCFVLQQGPLPISIWVLLALCVGRKAMLIPKHILLYIDPGAHDILAPWYDFHIDTPVPPAREAAHPLRQFIIEYMPQDMQPNLIRNNCEADEHEGWRIASFAAVLLGHHNPWNHPEFIALQEGLDVGKRFAASLRSQKALPLLVALYDRRIHTAAEVTSHLKYLDPIMRIHDKTIPYFVKLFRLRLEHYAHGLGHPNGLRLIEVTEEEYQLRRKDPLLRATMLLRGGSDSDMRPMDPNWRILFLLERALGAPIHFHTCFYNADVFLDRHLREILLEPSSPSVHRSSQFEMWLHPQLMHCQHNTI
ncbi:hypothetical protein C8R45DRAFT_1192654 [Mycena sanguinolenta]|nr:hypothetical protein C8R45DRAFT_1192654 [Mycena sanguinolenta]